MKILMIVTALTVGFATAASAQTKDFPVITTEDLNFREVTLPQDFPGEMTVVLIAYKRNQQLEINDWIFELELEKEGAPAWVELPVVSSAARAIKSVVDNGMRSGITSDEMRAKTITVYGRRAINEAIGVSGTSDVQVLVVERDGTILAQASGKVDEAKADIIRDALGG